MKRVMTDAEVQLGPWYSIRTKSGVPDRVVDAFLAAKLKAMRAGLSSENREIYDKSREVWINNSETAVRYVGEHGKVTIRRLD